MVVMEGRCGMALTELPRSGCSKPIATSSTSRQTSGELWEQRETTDFVLGVRSSRADGPVRVFITTVMRLTNFVVWGLWIRDANCPFKLMRRQAMEKVLMCIPRDSFIPMVMLSIICRKMNYRVREVVVEHLPRRGGEQSLSGLWKWIKVGSRCLRQLVALRMRLLWAH